MRKRPALQIATVLLSVQCAFSLATINGFWLTSTSEISWSDLIAALPASAHNVGSFGVRMGNGEKRRVCSLLKVQNRARKLCNKDTRTAAILVKAADLATSECQRQLKFERWNCTLGVQRVNMLQKGFRETSFLQSITSAALTYAFAQACRYQEMADQCPKFAPGRRTHRRTFRSGSSPVDSVVRLSDNFRFGYQSAERILGIYETPGRNYSLTDAATIHNYKAGMKMVRAVLAEDCKCTNLALCSNQETRFNKRETKSCASRLKSFEGVGKRLRKKYISAATGVQAKTKRGRMKIVVQTLTPKDIDSENFARTRELVYYEDTPAPCTNESTPFFPSPVGRVCYDSSDTDKRSTVRNCRKNCCARKSKRLNFIASREKQQYICDRIFHYCCWVELVKCEREITKYTCV